MRRTTAWLIATVVSVSACAGTDELSTPRAATDTYHGVELKPVPPRPSFVLRDTSGARFDFAEQTKGRPTLVFWGYTNCPDECPTAMADISAALRKVEPDLRGKVRVVFVTTDAARDTAPVVRRFLDQWSTEYVGLIGTQDELDAAARASGVAPGAVGPSPSTLPGKPNEHAHKAGTAPHSHFGPLGYSVAHASVIYAYDASDRLPVVYPGGVTPSDIAADLPVLART